MRHLMAVLAVVSLLFGAALSRAEEAPKENPKDAAIRAYLIESGTIEVALRVANNVFGIFVDQLQAQNPELPTGFTDELRYGYRKLLEDKAMEPGGFTDIMIPVYADVLSEAEAAELLAFTRSPLGKKLSENAGRMAVRGEEVGRQWGESLGPDIEAMVERLGRQYGLDGEEAPGEEGEGDSETTEEAK